MRRPLLTLTIVALVAVAAYLGYRGHSLSTEAQLAETLPVPASLIQNHPGEQRVAIERSYRNCLGQAVLDGRSVAGAAPDCEKRLGQVLPR